MNNQQKYENNGGIKENKASINGKSFHIGVTFGISMIF